MDKVVNVSGLEEYKSALEKYKGKTIFALFSGSSVNGESWCPDCLAADPVIEENLPNIPDGAVLIRCAVGDRTFWKDQNNVFRTNPELKLKSVPTLMKIGMPQRLQEEQCANSDLVKMLFTDE